MREVAGSKPNRIPTRSRLLSREDEAVGNLDVQMPGLSSTAGRREFLFGPGADAMREKAAAGAIGSLRHDRQSRIRTAKASDRPEAEAPHGLLIDRSRTRSGSSVLGMKGRRRRDERGKPAETPSATANNDFVILRSFW
jgi:hypothetical protein